MQHIEFFHQEHFDRNYFRKKASNDLSRFIDYFWEINFEELDKTYPQGFSDALFPNIGYTYLINLGTPFIMQLDDEKFEIKTDGFLPRHCNMICHHSPGNKIFGIKFKVSPVVFQKSINFAEYKDYIFPLSYLIDRTIIEQVKKVQLFNERVEIISNYYREIIDQHSGSLKYVDIVTSILDRCYTNNDFSTSIEDFAKQHGISSRTLQRYFEKATSINSKQALQVLRIRKAIEQLVTDPDNFDYKTYGYYDHSHFYKHLKQFINSHTISILEPHLKLLKGR
jgi:AraC-like DNA-binding protein